MRKNAHRTLPLILSGLILLALAGYWLSRQGISTGELVGALSRFRTPVVLAVLACASLQVFFMIARVWVLFPSSHRLGFRRVAEGMSLGQCLNTFAPARAGDVVKALIFSRGSREKGGVTLLTSAGVLVADRIVDIAALVLVVLGTGSLFVPGVLPSVHISRWWLVALPAALALVYLLYRWITLRFTDRLRGWLDHFRLGLTVLRNPRQLAAALLMGFLGWVCEVVALEFLCTAQGLPLHIDQLVFVLFALNVAIAVPISIANVGPFEAAIVFTLKRYGMPLPHAIAVASLHHWGQYAGIAGWALVMALLKRLRPEPGAPVIEESFGAQLEQEEQALEAMEKSLETGRGATPPLLRVPSEKEREAVLALAKLDRPGASLIDVGCGAGFYSLEAKRAGLRVHSVDPNAKQVMRLHGSVDEIEVAELEALEPHAHYDRVICAELLGHARSPESAFRTLCSLVAPAGRLVVLAPRAGLAGTLQRLRQRVQGSTVKVYSPTWLERVARECGLEKVAIREVSRSQLAAAFERAIKH